MADIRSREAQPAPAAIHALKSAGYTAVIWLVCLYALPLAIIRVEDAFGWQWARFDAGIGRMAAIVVFVLAAMVGIWSAFELITRGQGTPMPLECTRHLVITGPYRYLRNPMAAMGILQGLAVGVYRGSVLVLLYSLAGALFWHFVMRPWEEQDMRERFGPDYEHYQKEVPCWLPQLRPYGE